MAKWIVVLAVCLSSAGVLLAQDFGKREVFGGIGIGKTWDDEGSLGQGINGGGGFGYRLTRRLGVEAEVNGFRTERQFSFTPTPFHASGVFLMGNGLLYLNQGRGQFYLTGGAGLLHTRNQFGFAGQPVNRSGSGLAVDFGAGMKIYAWPHIYLRPEFKIYGGDSGKALEPFLVDLRVALSVGYHW